MKDIIAHIAKEQIPVQVIPGKVVAVDEANAVCDVEIDKDLTLYDVRIRAVVDGQDKGVSIVPVTGSFVLVGLINNDLRSAFVVLYSEIEKYRLIARGTELNGNQYGGLVISQEVAEDLNEIKQDLNAVKQVFSTWTPVAQDGGAALKAAITSWASQSLTQTQAADLENDKVKHGNE